jgi:hypothetical protein
MPSPPRDNAAGADPALDDGMTDLGVDYAEVVALLQDEVARLEQELRWRDEMPSEGHPQGAGPTRAEVDTAADAAERAGGRAEIQRLELELAGRDETIGLLLDQLSRVEEAQAADRAEWEHVAGWLAELEKRVEGQDGGAPPGLDDLRAENLRLRAALEESRKQLEAGPSQALDARSAGAIAERDELRRQLERVEDERKRERHEHAAALAELQAQLSRAELARPDEGSAGTGQVSEKTAPDREVDLRIRALRQHLLEIHEQEAEARRQKQLLPRLSRLWSRTGPR